MFVELRRPADRLGGVIHDEVQAVVTVEDEEAKGLHAGSVAQIQAEHLQSSPPFLEVRLGGVASRGVTGKPGGDDHSGAATPQQLDGGLIANLDSSSGEESDLFGISHHAEGGNRAGAIEKISGS